MTHFIATSGIAIVLGLSIVVATPASTGCSTPGAPSEKVPTFQQAANGKIREAKREALETSTKAQNKAAATQQEASKKAAEATQEANTAVAEANQKARTEGALAQANANVEIRRANRKTTGETTDLRQWSQDRMDALDNAIDIARAKEQSAAPKSRAAFEAGMKAIEIRRDALRAEVASIETQSAKNMADFKSRFDKAGDELEERVSALSAAL